MSDRAERLDELRRRAAYEREDLAVAVRDLRGEIDGFRRRWRFAGKAAGGVAAAAAVAWKLFGRNSLAARAGKLASAASLLLGVGRGVRQLRRFL